MASGSMLINAVNRINSLPAPFRRRLLTALVRTGVPYVGTSRLVIEEMTRERVTAIIANRRRVQNHINGVHATAMALLAETVSGFVVAMNLPGDKLPLIKTLKVDYRKRSKGGLRAVATLTGEQRAMMQSEPKGDVPVSVSVTDASGESPIECEMIWAWVPKKR